MLSHVNLDGCLECGDPFGIAPVRFWSNIGLVVDGEIKFDVT